MSDKNRAIFLMGPTASGKTELALSIAKELPCEIISVDSSLVYKGMDIGTAKPSTEEQASVPHHLIDIRSPKDTYSVGDFCQDASKCMSEIIARGNTPLLVGGTMLYFHSILNGIAELPHKNIKLRAELELTAAKVGWETLHATLAKVDPLGASKIKPTDTQRIQRYLEVYYATGKPMSDLQASNIKFLNDWDIKQFCIYPEDRSVLHARIEARFHQMLASGFVDEVKILLDKEYLNENVPAIRMCGYRQMAEYLKGTITNQTMIDKAIAATRQLAKRQLTWLRGWKHSLIPLDSLNLSESLEAVLFGCNSFRGYS